MDKSYKRKIRLFYKNNLKINEYITLDLYDTHYLKTVMRCKIGNIIHLFNNDDGEFESEIINFQEKKFILKNVKKYPRKENLQDLHLVFATVKKHIMEFIVQKGTELGVSEFFPVITDRSNYNKINFKRLNLIAKEAAEQCERLSVPKVNNAQSLINYLNNSEKNRTLIYADETIRKQMKLLKLKSQNTKIGSILIGPEGGFSLAEKKLLVSQKFIFPVSLGLNILKSDTASIVGLTYWHLLNSKE